MNSGFPINLVRLTDEARQALDLSWREAQSLGHNHVGPEHILLGLIRFGGIAADTLEALGVSAADVRNQLFLQQHPQGTNKDKLVESLRALLAELEAA